MKKSHVGLTIIRDSRRSGISASPSARPSSAGSSSSTARRTACCWTPTGINVPDYPKLAQIWWQQIGDVNSGAFTPQQAMDRLAERNGPGHGPHAGRRQEGQGLWRLRPAPQCREGSEANGSARDGPKAKLANEKPKGETIAYDELVKRWAEKKG